MNLALIARPMLHRSLSIDTHMGINPEPKQYSLYICIFIYLFNKVRERERDKSPKSLTLCLYNLGHPKSSQQVNATG